MRNFKKVLSLCLVLVMLCSVMSISAFATNYYTVTIHVQEAYRDTDGSVVYSYEYTDSGNPIEVSVAEGSSLKDAVIAACAQTNSIITNPVWKPSDTQYLISLSINGTPYANEDHFYNNTPETGMTTYEGLSWMYFTGTPADMPALAYNYPLVSLGNATVTADTTITLSFEYQTYVW